LLPLLPLTESGAEPEVMQEMVTTLEERQRRVQEQRETLLSFVQMRFPELTLIAKQQISTINDPGTLHNLLIKLFAVETAEEARQVVMEVGAESE